MVFGNSTQHFVYGTACLEREVGEKFLCTTFLPNFYLIKFQDSSYCLFLFNVQPTIKVI